MKKETLMKILEDNDNFGYNKNIIQDINYIYHLFDKSIDLSIFREYFKITDNSYLIGVCFTNVVNKFDMYFFNLDSKICLYNKIIWGNYDEYKNHQKRIQRKTKLELISASCQAKIWNKKIIWE
jgi:hypothetical protein